MDERTDRHDEANIAFRNIVNAPKKGFTEVYLARASKAKILNALCGSTVSTIMSPKEPISRPERVFFKS
jgi:hypothetical protein